MEEKLKKNTRKKSGKSTRLININALTSITLYSPTSPFRILCEWTVQWNFPLGPRNGRPMVRRLFGVDDESDRF